MKVVGPITGNSEHFSLYLFDCSMIFSGFYKLQIQTTLHSFVSYEQVPSFMHGGP
jgi:hypothetical protein